MADDSALLSSAGLPDGLGGHPLAVCEAFHAVCGAVAVPARGAGPGSCLRAPLRAGRGEASASAVTACCMRWWESTARSAALQPSMPPTARSAGFRT